MDTECSELDYYIMNIKEHSIIDEIIHKPNLFLGEKSITKLNYFVFGYITACLEIMQGVTPANETLAKQLEDFRQYIAQKYSEKRTIGWGSILLELAEQNESIAFDLFQKEWNEFCASSLSKKDYDKNIPTPFI